jgi:hypothetical protein
MSIKKRKPKMNRVVVGAIAPMRWVIKTSRSYHTTRRMIPPPVNNHNQEYSSRNFLLRTNSTTTNIISTLAIIAKIFCLKSMIFLLYSLLLHSPLIQPFAPKSIDNGLSGVPGDFSPVFCPDILSRK